MNDLLPAETKEDMRQVDQAISAALCSDIPLIKQIGDHILMGGGKRLRPLLLMLAARACGCENLSTIYPLAAVIEIIHTTTLLHDDVVDASERRRGIPTANIAFGNAASILVGDFLYSRAFQWMVNMEEMAVMRVLAEATNIIAEGEVLQLTHIGDTALTEEQYLTVIQRKTAKLFEASARLGAILSGASEEIVAALAGYGNCVGTAFQIIDDVLDFCGDAEEIGKNVGDDLAEGKLTLPLIYAMQVGSEAQAAVIKQAIEQGDRSQFNAILQIVRETGAIDSTCHTATAMADQAIKGLERLDNSLYKKTLVQLPRFVIERTF